MYAIIKTGGKQYKVQKGDLIDIELLEGEAGQAVEFKEVLFLSNKKESKVGEPSLQGCLVKGKLVETSYGPKVDSMKYKRRKSERRHFGHRQRYSRVEITDISTK